jgi:hypothetical protein
LRHRLAARKGRPWCRKPEWAPGDDGLIRKNLEAAAVVLPELDFTFDGWRG